MSANKIYHQCLGQSTSIFSFVTNLLFFDLNFLCVNMPVAGWWFHFFLRQTCFQGSRVPALRFLCCLGFGSGAKKGDGISKSQHSNATLTIRNFLICFKLVIVFFFKQWKSMEKWYVQFEFILVLLHMFSNLGVAISSIHSRTNASITCLFYKQFVT